MIKLTSLLTACSLCFTTGFCCLPPLDRPNSAFTWKRPCIAAGIVPCVTANTNAIPITTPAPTQAPDSMDSSALQVVEMVNRERGKQGLTALQINAKAAIAASIRANEIVVSFSHTRPGGGHCFTALQEAGVSYTGAGENIAKGQMTAERVMASWMSSPGHYANVMKESFTHIGVSHKIINGVHYWVQIFLR